MRWAIVTEFTRKIFRESPTLPFLNIKQLFLFTDVSGTAMIAIYSDGLRAVQNSGRRKLKVMLTEIILHLTGFARKDGGSLLSGSAL